MKTSATEEQRERQNQPNTNDDSDTGDVDFIAIRMVDSHWPTKMIFLCNLEGFDRQLIWHNISLLKRYFSRERRENSLRIKKNASEQRVTYRLAQSLPFSEIP